MRQRDPLKQREYARRHYAKHRAVMIARAKRYTKLSRVRVREWLLDYLSGHACVDCGEDDPVVLEFDHRGDKTFDIGSVSRLSYGLARVREEVAKCDVRCANCHRRKTYRERGHRHRG